MYRGNSAYYFSNFRSFIKNGYLQYHIRVFRRIYYAMTWGKTKEYVYCVRNLSCIYYIITLWCTFRPCNACLICYKKSNKCHLHLLEYSINYMYHTFKIRGKNKKYVSDQLYLKKYSFNELHNTYHVGTLPQKIFSAPFV